MRNAMMRALAVVVIGSAAVALPSVSALPLAFAAPILVFISVGLAIVVAGRPTPLVVSVGALAALLSTAAGTISGVLASTAFWAVVFLPRTLRARGPVAQGFHGALSLLGGALGVLALSRFEAHGFVVQGAAALVAALAAAAPMLIRVDDNCTFAFRALSFQTSGTLRRRMLRAVVLRRSFEPEHEHLTKRARRCLDRAWNVLLSASTDRVSATGAAVAELDGRISAYLGALGRALRAARTTRARAGGISDAVLAELESEGDDLEAHAQALAEV